MRYNRTTFWNDRRQAIADGKITPKISEGAFFAYLCQTGTISNLADVNWYSFCDMIFRDEEDTAFIDDLGNHRLKIAVLDFWIQHNQLVLGKNYGMQGMEDEDRVDKWREMLKSLQNKQQYDVAAILQQESNLQKDVTILKKQVAEISKAHYLDFIITEGKTPQEIKETEQIIKNTLPKGNPAIAKKLKELNLIGNIDILDIPDAAVLDSINTHFGTDIKYSAFHRAMDNVDARCLNRR